MPLTDAQVSAVREILEKHLGRDVALNRGVPVAGSDDAGVLRVGTWAAVRRGLSS
jgi:hypothetical protein